MPRAADSVPVARSRGHVRRTFTFTMLVLAGLLGTVAARPVEPAAATAGDEAAFVSALNQVRAGVGLPALSANAELANLARGHAQVMADAGEIFHADPISAGYGGPWAKLGENVGVTANPSPIQDLMDAFVASPGHYANIIDAGFSQVGVGVVWKDGAMYTTHRFLQLPGAPPPTTTAPPAPTTSAPLPPPTSTPPPPPPSTSPPPAPDVPEVPTTTTLAPLAPPAILPDRLVEVVGLLELVGT